MTAVKKVCLVGTHVHRACPTQWLKLLQTPNTLHLCPDISERVKPSRPQFKEGSVKNEAMELSREHKHTRSWQRLNTDVVHTKEKDIGAGEKIFDGEDVRVAFN